MHRGQLTNYFRGVAVKRLSAADTALPQHEINTTHDMRSNFLGENHRQDFDTTYLWLGEEFDGITYNDRCMHYNVRERTGRGAEWRLYYTKNSVTMAMKAGDTLFLAKDRYGNLLFIVTASQSTCEQQLRWLFGIEPNGEQFVSQELNGNGPELEFAHSFILERLGVEICSHNVDHLNNLIEQKYTQFPTTSEFSSFTRGTLPDVRADHDPDRALLAWVDREEALFFCLERSVVADRLRRGFMTGTEPDVDGFIKFSLSVQNRRKSRMGYSLENHIVAILEEHKLEYVRGAAVEHNHRPDFLFPSLEVYSEAVPDDRRLTVLGVKSSCKERWRQVLVEADKISCKHLLTLEPGISEKQTNQMKDKNLQLVVPLPIQKTYTEEQQEWLWSVSYFLEVLRQKSDFC